MKLHYGRLLADDKNIMDSDDPKANKSMDRTELYEEVWSDPVTVVAARYGLSDVGLAKICKRWQIPLPSRGYWAKVKAGRVMARVALPPLSKPPVIPVSIKKISDTEQAQKAMKRKTASEIRRNVSQENPEQESTQRHPLVLAAAKCLSKANPSPKGLLSAPEEVLHLAVTQSSLDRALDLARIAS
ncbi:hypothetical protein [Uliginosibacterium flavum]|uniref:hypothetical protein n=1 Tax=Uliginosibacterium flavum TaxID=1396831 RepID=UPI00339C2246